MQRIRGACIIKEGTGLPVDAQELVDLGFNLRGAPALEPDILITVAGRPHAFLLFDPLRADAGAGADVDGQLSARLSKLQQNFRTVYVLTPGSYGHAASAAFAAGHPETDIVTCYDAADAVGTAVRLIAQMYKPAKECGLSLGDVHTQRRALATDAAAARATLQALTAPTFASEWHVEED